jgi:DNA helicase-2/ATP-dependent DNA helicase PcrA
MYVGVTRAENKLYLTTAKRRQMWGEYKYYTPSRFLEEIPVNLLEEEESEYSEYSSNRSTFRSAVKTVKQSGGQSYERNSRSSFTPDGKLQSSKGFGSNFVAPSGTKNTTTSANSNGFGSDFVAPKISKTTTVVKRTPSRVIIKKNPINKEKEDEKLKAFFENNPMKKRIEEQKKIDAQQAEEERRQEELRNATVQYFFNVGERVFHEKLGIGHIADVIQVGDSTMYTIDFGKLGKKAMDASYARLKKF